MFKALFYKCQPKTFLKAWIWGLGALFLFYGMGFVKDLYEYSQLRAKTAATVEQWNVVEFSLDSYGIEATYSFLAGKKKWEGKTLFGRPYALNRFSAERVVQAKAVQSWSVWYDPKNPQSSSLEREWPVKKCMQMVCVLGLWGYFAFLGLSPQRERGQD